MKIEKELAGSVMTMSITGRLDTVTAPELDTELRTSLSGVTELVFDFSALDYISSAGLRVVLNAQKMMSRQGTFIVRHVNADVMDVFEMTGFSEMLTIEN